MKNKIKIINIPKIVIGITVLLITSTLVVIPIWLQVHEKANYITFDTWLQFFGSVGSAILGGSVTAIGLYLSLKENRKVLKLQQINEDLENLNEFHGIICDLFVQSQILCSYVEKENIISLNETNVSELFVAYATNLDKYTKINNKIANVDYHLKALKAYELFNECISLIKQTEYKKEKLLLQMTKGNEKAQTCKKLYTEILSGIGEEIRTIKKLKYNILSK